jgi:hypothetical protein
MNNYRVKRLVGIIIFLLAAGLKGNHCSAQSVAAARDSMALVVQVNILGHRFLIAGELYKVGKYKLPYNKPANADSLYQYCVKEYNRIYTAISPEKRALYFSDIFYEQTIPVAQYFRNQEVARLLISHQQELHPTAAAPDPKHHDGHPHHHHEE